mmetsp:Transcript_21870/g.47689  ORF Transcript_21870/g.47689 Transcript_21870/m.47689 type:complete len:155 (-) Transcript_21870:140-604(-)
MRRAPNTNRRVMHTNRDKSNNSKIYAHFRGGNCYVCEKPMAAPRNEKTSTVDLSCEFCDARAAYLESILEETSTDNADKCGVCNDRLPFEEELCPSCRGTPQETIIAIALKEKAQLRHQEIEVKRKCFECTHVVGLGKLCSNTSCQVFYDKLAW